jgi:3'(2'), 5'-bisphosphate nucleotidase
MDSEILASLLDAVRPLAVAAGKAILPIAAEVGDVQTKQDGSPLTRADLASHEVIAAGLAKLEPAFPILSEEGDPDTATETWTTFWCVDPLDGTKEFVKGLDEYTVNIALIEKGAAVLGVVYVPAQDVLYYAAQGLGAWKVEPGGQPQRIAASGCQIPTSAVVSRSHLSEETKMFLEKLGISEMISHGSSIKICAVAEGKADIYPRHGPTCLWDTAAGAAVAREAGCRVVDLQNHDLSYDPQASLKRPGFIVYPAQLDISAGI